MARTVGIVDPLIATRERASTSRESIMSPNRLPRAGAVLIALAVIVSGCAARLSVAPQPTSDADMVDVGYGTLPRARVIGSISSLSRAQIGEQHVWTVADLLERVPGVQVVQVAGNVSVRVRSASHEALVVVDGTPLRENGGIVLLTLRPADIERIDVIKDTGGTGNYAAHGSNGVVLITTRRTR
jgi:outer membrane receptor for ferrienterochelin and colicin